MNIKYDPKKHRLSGDFDPKAYTIIDTFDYSAQFLGKGDQDENVYADNCEPLSDEVADELHKQGVPECNCSHCGHQLVRGVVCRHTDGDLIILGNQCVNRLNFDSADQITESIRQNKFYYQGLRKALKVSPRYKYVIEALQSLLDNADTSDEWCVNTAKDMLKKLSMYFSMSDKQIEFAMRLPYISKERTEKRQRQAEVDAQAPDWTEEGRQVITGTVLTVKEQENDFGTVWKMLVKLDDGRKCWGSVPSQISPERGDKIQFTATVSISHDDRKFAFFSRPAKGQMLEVQS